MITGAQMVNEAKIRSHKRTSKEDRGSHARIDPMRCQWLAYWLHEQSDLTLANWPVGSKSMAARQ